MLALFVLSAASVNAQVTIGTTDDPHKGAILDLKSTEKGLLLPKVSLDDVALFQLATSPADIESGEGMAVYNINENITGGNGKGVYVWDGQKWAPIGSAQGIAIDKSKLQNLVTTASQYISREAEYTPETFDPFKTAYNAAIALLASATASQAEVDAAWNTLTSAIANLQLKPVKILVESITITGSANVKMGATAQMNATVLPANATDKGITWSVTNGSGKATINASGVLTGTALGTVTVEATAKDGSNKSNTFAVWIDKQAATSDCGAYIAGGVWLPMMCHNLGADESKDPFTHSEAILGDLYQWGRVADGHEKRTSAQVAGPATAAELDGKGQVSASAKKGKFLTASSPFDWRTPQDDTLWGNGSQNQSVSKAANDPCPSGWKLPTQKQWAAIRSNNNTWTWTGSGYLVGEALYLPAAGSRGSDGSLYDVGTGGYYWSSTVNGAEAYRMQSSETGVGDGYVSRASGMSVRCISE